MEKYAWIRTPRNISLDNNIESNIAAEFDSKKIDKIKLKNSINTSNCHEFINKLPEGVNTNVGERCKALRWTKTKNWNS